MEFLLTGQPLSSCLGKEPRQMPSPSAAGSFGFLLLLSSEHSSLDFFIPLIVFSSLH